MVTYTRCLDELKKILYDNGEKQAHQDTVKTLFKILENLIFKENDIKVRMLPKTNKSVQQKILAFPQAIKYLETAGFNFSKPETIELSTFDKSLIQ
jgi:predicted transcriptional regulator